MAAGARALVVLGVATAGIVVHQTGGLPSEADRRRPAVVRLGVDPQGLELSGAALSVIAGTF